MTASQSAVLLLALFALALSTPPACAQPASPPEKGPGKPAAPDGPTDFLRFVRSEKEEEGRLEAAMVTYRDERGVEVTLASAVHVADGAYYRALGKLFDEQDRVLYELVAPAGSIPVRGEASGGLIGMLQRTIQSFLELEFQLDAIDYRRKNFVHADMDPASFRRAQEERGESMFSWILDLVMKEMSRGGEGGELSAIDAMEIVRAFTAPDRARRVKLLLAEQFDRLEGLLSELGETGTDDAGAASDDRAAGEDGAARRPSAAPPEGDDAAAAQPEKEADGTERPRGSVLVHERNRVAMKVLDREIGRGHDELAIFYGAGHMPDFEQRLRDRGFRKVKESWLTAWDIR